MSIELYPREPECNEVCEAGDGEDCTVSNEVVCRAVSDPVSHCPCLITVLTVITSS